MGRELDRPRRILLAHDWLVGRRGGEAVLERAAEALIRDGHEIVAVATMFDSGASIGQRVDTLTRITPRVGRTRLGAGPLRRWLLPMYPMLIASLSRRIEQLHRDRSFDLLLSTSSAAVHGIRPPRGVRHVCYVHSPARYLWNLVDEHAGGFGGFARRLGLALTGPALRRWDRARVREAGLLLANSEHTRESIRRVWGNEHDVRVIHPPVRTEFFTPEPGLNRGNFWLCAGALEPQKRVDLAIEAARHADAELVIVGEGSARRSLGRLSGGSSKIRMMGRVGDDELRTLFRTARLLAFPQIEDFGIVAVEALACGCPVVARGAGGALDIVEDGITGSIFTEATPQALCEAVERLPSDPDVGRRCREHSMLFSESRFDEAIRVAIRDS